MKRQKFNCTDIKVTTEIDYYGYDIEFTTYCDFEFDEDDKEVNYYGKGWILTQVDTDDITFTNKEDDIPEVRDAVYKFINSVKFEEIAIEVVDDKARDFYDELYSEHLDM